MNCPDCTHENPPEAKFCAACGARLEAKCGHCGTEYVPGARFCIECGNALESGQPADKPEPGVIEDGAERRQLTIMFCDLVGSTRLSTSVDPEDLREITRRYRELCTGTIEGYDGFIARYMGDGVLAYYGYPRAHEDDAIRAVHSALEIAAAIPTLMPESGAVPLAVRLGIATGPVVVGDLIGEGASLEHDVVGETPNLAARLQGLAPENSVVVSGETRRLLGALFELHDLGDQELKGFEAPVRAFQVIDTATVDSRFEAAAGERLTPFVGRDHEISLIKDRWRRVLNGEGQVVLLNGEPGIGKSRITMATREFVAPDDPVTVRCQCSPYHENSTLYPIVEHLQRAAGFRDGDPPEARLDKLEELMGYGSGTSGEDMALFASLMSLPCGDRYPVPDLPPEVLRDRTLEALQSALAKLAEGQPLMILMEDVHWSDPTTLELLNSLVDQVQSWRALLIITFRPEFDPPWTGDAHVSLLSLNRLDRRQCEAIIDTLAGGLKLPEEIVEQIATRTDGVPLFVEELTRTILESGLLNKSDGEYVLSGPIQPLAIPTTLQDSLMARLDQLDDAKSVAQLGAVIGREFSRALLSAVGGHSPEVIDSILRRLIESGLLSRRGTGANATFVFKHALVRDAAYNSILKSRRHALHARIADALLKHFPDVEQSQPELIAQHYTAAGLDDQALDYWTEAGRRAMERSAYPESISHFRSGLESLARIGLGEDTAEQTVELKIAIAECLRVIDRLDEAFAMLDEAERIAGEFNLTRLLSRTHHQRGNLYFPTAKVEACLSEHRRALKYAQSAGSVEDEIRALGGLGDGHYLEGKMRTANEYFVRCVDLAQSHGHIKTAAAYQSMIGFSRMYSLELKASRDDGDRGIEMADEASVPRAELMGRQLQGMACLFMGQYEQALEPLQQALEVTHRLNARRFEPQVQYYVALCLDGLGRRTEACKLLEDAEPAGREYSRSFTLVRVLSGIVVTSDDPERRERAFEEAADLLNEGVVSHNYMAFALDISNAAFEHHEWDRMDYVADMLEDYTREEPLPWCNLVIDRARALAAWGRGDRSSRLIGELKRLRSDAVRAEFNYVVRNIDAALNND